MFASKAAPRYWKQAATEANVADFVSVSAPVSEHDTITRAGDYLRVWRLEGVAFEASDAQVISDRHESLCNLLRNLPSGQCAAYAHRIQRRVTDRLTDPSEPSFSVAFSKFYQDKISAKPLMSKELYITLLYRPYPSAMAKR
ncbi:MAG: VirB4 family type IV secretion/conjugal transfer ATPase, partial [Pseudomonadota bacterium]|nr:VirB4 family type IV secretion/conjugal transfer ATPase [Pseudomonadota bacterium]